MSEESTGEFNLMEAAAELTSEDGTGQDSTQGSVAEGQLATDPNQNANENTLSAEDILKQVSEEKPVVDQELIEKLNALGAIHNGMPIKVNSPDELKELVQKGFDYTKKTMAHAEEVRMKQEEFSKIESQYKEKETVLAQKEQELQNVSFENKIMENLLLKWQTEDPELFSYLSSAFTKEVRSFEMQKPIITQYENQFKQLNDRFAQLEKGKQQEELGSIKQSWEKELGDVQTRQAAALAKLGVKPDWEKVKQAWSADSTNKMSVEQALYAVHGKDIMKANESYQKMLATKNKTQSKILGRSGVGAGSPGAKETIQAPVGNYESILRQAANQF